MTRLLTAVVLAALAFAAFGAGVTATAETSKRTAVLQLASGKPLKLRGTGFLPGERVHVRVIGKSARKSKVVSAGTAGRFVVGFPTVPFDRCNGLFAEAVGARGSFARLKLPQPLCPPN